MFGNQALKPQGVAAAHVHGPGPDPMDWPIAMLGMLAQPGADGLDRAMVTQVSLAAGHAAHLAGPGGANAGIQDLLDSCDAIGLLSAGMSLRAQREPGRYSEEALVLAARICGLAEQVLNDARGDAKLANSLNAQADAHQAAAREQDDCKLPEAPPPAYEGEPAPQAQAPAGRILGAILECIDQKAAHLPLGQKIQALADLARQLQVDIGTADPVNLPGFKHECRSLRSLASEPQYRYNAPAQLLARLLADLLLALGDNTNPADLPARLALTNGAAQIRRLSAGRAQKEERALATQLAQQLDSLPETFTWKKSPAAVTALANVKKLESAWSRKFHGVAWVHDIKPIFTSLYEALT